MLPVSAEEQTLASVTPVCIIILQILSCCVCIITFLNKKKVFIHVELWVVLVFLGFFGCIFFLSWPDFQVFGIRCDCKTIAKKINNRLWLLCILLASRRKPAVLEAFRWDAALSFPTRGSQLCHLHCPLGRRKMESLDQLVGRWEACSNGGWEEVLGRSSEPRAAWFPAFIDDWHQNSNEDSNKKYLIKMKLRRNYELKGDDTQDPTQTILFPALPLYSTVLYSTLLCSTLL